MQLTKLEVGQALVHLLNLTPDENTVIFDLIPEDTSQWVEAIDIITEIIVAGRARDVLTMPSVFLGNRTGLEMILEGQIYEVARAYGQLDSILRGIND